MDAEHRFASPRGTSRQLAVRLDATVFHGDLHVVHQAVNDVRIALVRRPVEQTQLFAQLPDLGPIVEYLDMLLVKVEQMVNTLSKLSNLFFE